MRIRKDGGDRCPMREPEFRSLYHPQLVDAIQQISRLV
jgi:hypothetical protein